MRPACVAQVLGRRFPAICGSRVIKAGMRHPGQERSPDPPIAKVVAAVCNPGSQRTQAFAAGGPVDCDRQRQWGGTALSRALRRAGREEPYDGREELGGRSARWAPIVGSVQHGVDDLHLAVHVFGAPRHAHSNACRRRPCCRECETGPEQVAECRQHRRAEEARARSVRVAAHRRGEHVSGRRSQQLGAAAAVAVRADHKLGAPDSVRTRASATETGRSRRSATASRLRQRAAARGCGRRPATAGAVWSSARRSPAPPPRRWRTRDWQPHAAPCQPPTSFAELLLSRAAFGPIRLKAEANGGTAKRASRCRNRA